MHQKRETRTGAVVCGTPSFQINSSNLIVPQDYVTGVGTGALRARTPSEDVTWVAAHAAIIQITNVGAVSPASSLMGAPSSR